jgi:hypothetical protein
MGKAIPLQAREAESDSTEVVTRLAVLRVQLGRVSSQPVFPAFGLSSGPPL